MSFSLHVTIWKFIWLENNAIVVFIINLLHINLLVYSILFHNSINNMIFYVALNQCNIWVLLGVQITVLWEY